MMMTPVRSFSDAVAFHGHSCPGLALGYRAVVYAMTALSAHRSEYDDLVALVENTDCGADAFQAVAGCSAGKGNLVLSNLGKSAFTLIDRKSNRAIRLVLRPEPVIERLDPVASVLRGKVLSGTATPAERTDLLARQVVIVQKILAMPVEELFIIKEVKPEIPERAKPFQSVQCSCCGELVAEHRARVRDGNIVCIPCAGEYPRR